MAAKDPVARKLSARAAALARWSKQDTVAGTAAARAGRAAAFERQVDPDGVLAPAERSRRARRAQHAHMIRMSAIARERRAAA